MASITEFVESELGADQSGHNFQHAERVAKLSQEIAKKEKGDERICLAAAWLHDCVDEKLFKDTAAQEAKVAMFCGLTDITKGRLRR